MSIFYMSKLTLLQLYALWLIDKKPRHGYELMNDLKPKEKKVTQGTIYPLLRSLESDGLIRSKKEGKRGKKMYTVTKKGKNVLKRSCEYLCDVYKDIFKKYICGACGR